MPERILEADVDAELLRRNRLGESHTALADAFGCSKSLVQRRIARAKLAECRVAEGRDHVRPKGHSEAGKPTVGGLADDAHAPIQVRAEYERIVRESRDTRSVVAALKELERLDREGDPPRARAPRRDGIWWRGMFWTDEPECIGVLLSPKGKAIFIFEKDEPDHEHGYTPMTKAEIEELSERIAAERAARRSRLARRIWDLRRQAAAAQGERPAG